MALVFKPQPPVEAPAEEVRPPVTSIRSFEEAMGHINELRRNKQITTDVVTVAREVYLLNHGAQDRELVKAKGKEIATRCVVDGLRMNRYHFSQVQAWVWIWMALETKDRARQMLDAIEDGLKEKLG